MTMTIKPDIINKRRRKTYLMRFKCGGVTVPMDIRAFFQEHCGVDNEALLSELVEKTRIRNLEKNTTVLEPGTEAISMFFLASGIVRSYFWGRDERTYTDGFFSQPGTLLSFGCTSSCRQEYGMETVSKCEILELMAADAAALMEKSLPFMQMCCRMLDRMLYLEWRDKTACYQYTPQQRYQRFIDLYPDWKGQISSRYIADYVGIAPESLSRLRRRMRDQKQII